MESAVRRPKSNRRSIAQSERQRRQQQALSEPANDHQLETERTIRALEPLLVSRREAARLLGNISTSTMLRLDASGALHPIRLTSSRTAMAFYNYSEVCALAARGVTVPIKQREANNPPASAASQADQ
jgi:hypothetical protein